MTPVIEERHNARKPFGRFNKDIDEYNLVADQIMSRAEVMVNDLHGTIAADPQRFLANDGVHLSDEGQQAAAKAVVDSVHRLLASRQGR